jgi:molybdopterin-binding protein
VFWLVWYCCEPYDHEVPNIRIREAAGLLGVSDDTVRRWIDSGQLSAAADDSGRKVIDGAELAAFARSNAAPAPTDPLSTGTSARNRFAGLVTKVVTDTVMAQVELQCGPFTVVSLMSAEAVRELALEVGSIAAAVVKATTVIVETPSTPKTQ